VPIRTILESRQSSWQLIPAGRGRRWGSYTLVERKEKRRWGAMFASRTCRGRWITWDFEWGKQERAPSALLQNE
jgi:hypothetical protein